MQKILVAESDLFNHLCAYLSHSHSDCLSLEHICSILNACKLDSSVPVDAIDYVFSSLGDDEDDAYYLEVFSSHEKHLFYECVQFRVQNDVLTFLPH